MKAPVSIVIPTLNAVPQLGPTAAALFAGVEEGLVGELILSDGGSTDGIEKVAEGIGAVLISGPAGRGGQLSRGAEAAKGEWLLFLHADTVLAEWWTSAVRDHLNTAKKTAGYFRLRFDQKGLRPGIVARWANLRSRLFGLPYGDQGLLISRELFDEIGGFADIPLMEDVAIARRLKGRLCALQADATTGSDRYVADGWFWKGTKNFWLLARYFMGVSPEVLARSYRKDDN